MKQARLVSLELEAFRGFAVTQRFDLDADVVLVRGDNGTGKTSMVDGLLWLFTGNVPRLSARAQGLRKSEDIIVSRYRPEGPARVRLEIALADGSGITFEREGRAATSTLLAWDGDSRINDAPALLAHSFGFEGPTALDEALGSWGILQQHAVLAALDSGPALHQRLAEVVGFERVTHFAAAATEAARAVKADAKRLEDTAVALRERRAAAEARLRVARSRVTEESGRPRLPELIRACLSELPEGIRAARMPSQLEDVAALGREVSDTVEAARDVAAVLERLERSEAEAVATVDEVHAELAALLARADAAVRRAPAQVQLASAALDLMGDSCPVCRQAIDAASVREHLSEMLRTARDEAGAATQAQQAVAEAQARLGIAQAADARRTAAREELGAATTRLQRGLSDAAWLTIERSWLAPAGCLDLAAELARLQDRLRVVYAEARRTSAGEVARLASDLSAVEHELERSAPELDRLRERAVRATALDHAAHVAAQRIVERVLERLAPSFAEVFDRLSPHPTFTELRANHDIFYGKNQVVPEVWDPVRKVGGNPALILSEGQLNVVALSYFLGLALNAGSAALPFLVLDDPLQAMDVLSVLGFSDLCRRMREHRQLVVMTHDRRFAALLGRKLAPRESGTRTILHEFDGWTEEGPRVKSSDEPLADVVPLLSRRAS